MALDQEIRSGKYPNCITFAEKWQVSQKTIQRDIDFLRDQQGAPIEYDRDKKGFYYTDTHWFLPSISLSEGDLLALLMASKALESYRGTPVAKELERVFSKIAGLLPDTMSIQPELVFHRFTFTAPPSKPIDEAIWTTMVRALLHQHVVNIAYQSFEAKEKTQHIIEPYHIANLVGEWYIFAHCRSTGELAQFALPRISKAKLTEDHFSVPDDFDAKKMLSSTFGRFVLGTPQKVKLLFDKDIAPWVLERQWHPRQKAVKKKNGNIELSFEAAGLFEVFRWVMAWGRHCKVLAPKELRDMVLDEIRAMVSRK